MLFMKPKCYAIGGRAQWHSKFSSEFPNEPRPNCRMKVVRIAETEISQLLEGATPRLIDEWQDIPELWDAIRHIVDHRDGMGQYILTGSSVLPEKKKKQIKHSGTGRYSWLKMRPMSLWESGESSGEVIIGALFAGQSFTAARAIERKLSETAEKPWWTKG